MTSIAAWNLKHGIKTARVSDLEKVRIDLEVTIAELCEVLEISPATYHRMKRRPDHVLDPATSCLVAHIKKHHLSHFTGSL